MLMEAGFATLAVGLLELPRLREFTLVLTSGFSNKQSLTRNKNGVSSTGLLLRWWTRNKMVGLILSESNGSKNDHTPSTAKLNGC